MEELPRITLKYFFEEVMIHHVDQAIKRSLQEFMSDPELQEKVYEVIRGSKEATQAVLASSVRSGVKPPEIATAIQMGIVIGVGLALELLNEKEIVPDGSGSASSDGSTTIQ